MSIRWSPDDRSATMRRRVAGVLILLASTAGCSGGRPAAAPVSTGTTVVPAGASPSESAGRPELARGCPPALTPPGGGQAAVDYVDFLQANGRNYIADLGGRRVSISATDLGSVALQVRCSYAAVNNATGLVFGQPRDGDAAYLPPGTNVYNVRGWPPLCRLAAMHDHVLHVYLAYQPGARVATPEPCALHRGT